MRRLSVVPSLTLTWLLPCAIPPCPTALAGEPCHYTWVELPRPLPFVYPVAINNRGEVAGQLQGGGDSHLGFVWRPETGMQILQAPPGTGDLRPYDMNDLGHVCGTLSIQPGYRPFFWDGENFTIIEIPAWANLAEGFAINNRDQVAGMVQNNGIGPTLAFIWETGLLTVIEQPEGASSSFGVDINYEGAVLIRAWVDGAYRGLIHSGSKSRWLEAPGDTVHVYANDFNDRRTTAGYSITTRPPAPPQASGLIWSSRGFQRFEPWAGYDGLVFGAANNADRAIGGLVFPSVPMHSTEPVVAQSGAVRELLPMMLPQPAPTFITEIANAINDVGQIVTSRYVLTPVWLPGDITGDCHVTMNDLALVLIDFGAPLGSFPRGDADADGDVDLSDLAVLLAHWGE